MDKPIGFAKYDRISGNMVWDRTYTDVMRNKVNAAHGDPLQEFKEEEKKGTHE